MNFYTARQLDYISFREAKALGQQFAEWLNATGGTTLVLRLLELEKSITQLNQEYDDYSMQLPEDGPEEDEVSEAMSVRLEKMMTKFNQLISHCQIYPRLIDLDFMSDGWTFRWDLVNAPRKQLRKTERLDPRVTLDDLDALMCIVRLAQNKMLSRLRKCHCKRWYFERMPHQQFCSSKCRQAMFSNSDKFRAHRREYMRKYYKLKTSGKVK